MVTLIKIKNSSGYINYFNISSDFKDANGFSVFDRMLVKVSPCGEYEYLYLFLNQLELNSFINLSNEYHSEVLSTYDFTNELINIIVNDKIEDFKSSFEDMFDFDDLIKIFYETSITKDNVLDKISFNGKQSLTEIDYTILNR